MLIIPTSRPPRAFPLPWPRGRRAFLALCLLVLGTSAALPAAQAWTQVWSDEFNGSGLPDASKWGYEEGYVRGGEPQYYTRDRVENARQEGGNLVITCRREPSRFLGVADITSASLITQGKYQFTYGRLEMRAQMPAGAGAWPGFWTLGANRSIVGKTYCGEMDVLEWLGSGPDSVHGALHWFNGTTTTADASTVYSSTSNSPKSGFHIYATEWFPDHIDWYYDAVKYHTVTLAQTQVSGYDPFHKPHYILLNYAIGPGNGNFAGAPDFNALPGQYLVDYVRVYAPVGAAFNQAPSVTMNPLIGTLQDDANVWISATAADSDGSVAKVEFFDGSTLINTQNDSPQSFTYRFAAGSHSLTAKATDNLGATTTSAALAVTVASAGNAAPTVTMTPLTGTFNAPAGIAMAAVASDSNGTIAKVEFWKISGSAAPTLLGTASAAPFTFTWNNAPEGDHDIIALAYDNQGVASAEAAGQYGKYHVVAGTDRLPVVSLSQPANSSTYAAAPDPLGTVVTLEASASDPDGSIASVDFLANGNLVSRATGTTLGIPPTTTYKQDWKRAPAGVYTVTARVTDDRGATVTSAPVTITVGNPTAQAPAIVTQPTSQSVLVGQTTTFTVAAIGVPTPTFQWQSAPAGSGAFTSIAGATAASFTVASPSVGLSGTQYRSVATNASGAATSNVATLTVSAGTVIPPTITRQPQDVTIAVGQSATFSVAASGTGPFTYQWQRNGVAIAGATAATYSTPPAVSADTGASFRCLVTATGTATSNAATLTVTAALPPFQQDAGADGIVSLEAEDYAGILSQGGHSWIPSNDQPGFSGSGAMIADPADGAVVKSPNHLTGSPRMDYRITFVKTGVHFVWLRGWAGSAVENSLHIGLDGVEQFPAEKIAGFNRPAFGQYAWENQHLVDGMPSVAAYIDVTTPGVHILNVFMRSAGLRLDKIVLTTSPTFVPSGTGPVESPHAGAPANQPPTASFTATPISGTAPLPVTFSGAASSDVDGSIGSFAWTFGDGTSATGATASHTYAAAGAFTATLTVTDNLGATASTTRTISVGGAASAPVITTQPTATTVNAGQTATLTVVASGTGPLSFAWRRGSTSVGTNSATLTIPNAQAGDAGAYTVVVSNAIGTATSVAAIVTVTALPVAPALRINAGGGVAGTFAADQGFTGGATSTTSATVLTAGVANAAPAAVYQSERYGNFSYTVSGLTAGSSQTVRLHFAEIYWAANGKRVFNVTVNGIPALTNFDIHAIAGANQAVVRDVPALATGAGTIVVAFSTVVDNATLAGIEIITAGTTPPPPPGTLPAPWNSQDVGTTTPSGSATVVNEIYTITGAGADIWNGADGFHAVAQAVTGDCDLVARVDSIQNTDGWAKAGVMLRATLDAGSAHAMCVATAGNGMAFQNRTSTGATSNHIAGSNTPAPRWVKITRRANLFSGYESADGITWLPIGQQTVAMPASIQACLVVTSHAQGTPCTAVLSQVGIAPVASN